MMNSCRNYCVTEYYRVHRGTAYVAFFLPIIFYGETVLRASSSLQLQFTFSHTVPTPMAPDISINIHGSLKKRIAPPPPPASTGNAVASGVVLPSSHYGTLPTLATSTHSRTTSEPILAGHTLHTLPHTLNTLNSQHHKRSPSGDSSTGHGTFDR